MKATIRIAASLGGALSLATAAFLAAPLPAQSRASDEVPRLMVVPFHSNEKGLGAQASEEVRQRIASDVSVKLLGVVPKTTVCANLEASGFSCDSVPDQLTSRLLASSLRTESFLVGTVTKTAGAMRLDTRLYVTSFQDMSQPLPVANGTKVGALAEQVSKSFQAARKQIPDFTACMNAVRNGDPAAAQKAADAAIVIYPQSTIARICLANVLLKRNAGGDSVLDLASKVVELDPRNKLALSMMAEEWRKRGQEFKTKGMADSSRAAYKKAVEAWTNLLVADPKNPRLQADIVNNIGAVGMAADARPIIIKAVEENPGDPDLVKLEWQILLATRDTNDVRHAVTVGEEMVRVDTSAADTTFFIRQSAAYAQLLDPQTAAKTVSAGLIKFPLNLSLWTLDVKVQRLAGNAQGALDAATKLVQLDSSNGQSYLQLAQAQIDLQQVDQAIATIRIALHPPAGGPKPNVDAARAAALARDDTVLAGKLLLVMGNKALQAANAANPKRRDDFKRAVAINAFADSVAPSPSAKLLVGLSAFNAGDLGMRENDKLKKCDLAKEASNYFSIAQINIAAGGATDPKIAGQVMSYLSQVMPVTDGQTKKFCK